MNNIILTSCGSDAPVAPRHVAFCHSDRHYSRYKSIQYSTFRGHGTVKACMCSYSSRSVTVTHPGTIRVRRSLTQFLGDNQT